MKRILLSGSNYGRLIILIGLLSGFPVVVLPFFPYEVKYLPSFLIPAGFSLAAGFFICAKTYLNGESKERQPPLQRTSLMVLFVWSCSFFIGAAPFIISGQLSFIHALFESVNSWTTAGMTVADVAAMPHIFLFHRSFMQYCGGLGFILMMTMVVYGKHSMALYNAEGHSDRLKPNLAKTSRAILKIYCGVLILGTFLYRVFGMGLFEALCHTMSAVSTAGFTTRAGGIGEYKSVAVEMVTVILMLAGASNFAVLLLLTEGKIRRIFRVTEMRFMFGIIAVFVPASALSLFAGTDMGLGESFRQALFGTVSVLSTTGYSTMNYALWPSFALGLLMLLMVIGGSADSTSGGIKLSRVYLLLRVTRENIRTRMMPPSERTSPSFNTARGDTPIDSKLVADTFGFAACYVSVLIIGTLLITLTEGSSLFDAMFEFASALSTSGVSNGLTSVNTNTATLIVEMAGMVLGRLEIFVVLFGVHSALRLTVKKIKGNKGNVTK